MNNFKKFFTYFGQNRKDFYKYSILSFIVGLLELFGVALTYPFVLKLLSDNYKGVSPIFLGILIVFLFLVKNIIMISFAYFQSKFTKSVEAEVSSKFMQYFLVSTYQKSSQVSLAEKLNILNFIIPNVINNYVLRLLNLNVNFFIFGLITIFLFIKFPAATILTTAFAIVLIFIQNSFFKPRLQKFSEQLNKACVLFTQKLNDALINIKSVKISNNEYFFFNNYKKGMGDMYKNQQEILFLNIVPPYVTEPFIILLLFILLAVISFQNYSEPHKLVASFALIVSAIFRLAPTISRIQVNLNGISSAKPLIDKLLKYYEDFQMENMPDLSKKDFAEFRDCIELKNVSFEYETGKPVLKDINLCIKKGEFIGIAGFSGAGKTTLIDIISGLYEKNCGELLVDGQCYEKPLKIGYIPQELITINGSVRENVAFGSQEINDEKIIEALKQAQLYDFVTKNYKDGIYANPFVDSTGFSLGQKQRLAIARALYSNPDILIMDEATSSLDLKTEEEICNVLKSLKGSKTIIAIAHRLSTIKSADKIAFLHEGKIENFAPFNELITQNKNFKELVDLASLNN